MTESEWRVLKALAKHGVCDAKTIAGHAAPDGLKRPDDWVRARLSSALKQGWADKSEPAKAGDPVLWTLTRDGSRALKQSRAG